MFLKKAVGFSLLSIIIALFVTSILSLGVIVSYQSFILRFQLTAITNRLVAALRFAQNEALTRGQRVIFCPKGVGGDYCGGDWRQGQLILREIDGHVMRVLPAIPQRFQLRWFSRLGLNKYIVWDQEGFTVGQQGSFWLCAQPNGQQSLGRQIVLLSTGAIHVRTGCKPAISGLNTY